MLFPQRLFDSRHAIRHKTADSVRIDKTGQGLVLNTLGQEAETFLFGAVAVFIPYLSMFAGGTALK